MYWTKQNGHLAKIIEKADAFDADKIADYGRKAKQRVKEAYSWEYICSRYEDVFTANTEDLNK